MPALLLNIIIHRTARAYVKEVVAFAFLDGPVIVRNPTETGSCRRPEQVRAS